MKASADVIHDEPTAMRRHKADLSDLCDICGPLLVRSRRITKCHAALVQFGYAGLTREETAEAYDKALAGPVDATDGIIAMFVHGFLQDAGIVR
jgi:hypothetical protein